MNRRQLLKASVALPVIAGASALGNWMAATSHIIGIDLAKPGSEQTLFTIIGEDARGNKIVEQVLDSQFTQNPFKSITSYSWSHS